jgi:hypothetical protein
MRHKPAFRCPADQLSHILFAAKAIPNSSSICQRRAVFSRFSKRGYLRIRVSTSHFNQNLTDTTILSTSLTLINDSMPIEPPVSSRFSPIQL